MEATSTPSSTGGESTGISKCCSTSPRSRLTVNRRLLPIKVFYFMTLAAMACVVPYAIVYTKKKGLSSQESGLLFGMMPFFSFLVLPLVGMMADRWRKHKAVIMTTTVVTGVFYVLMTTVPARQHLVVMTGDVIVTCDPRQPLSLKYCGYNELINPLDDNVTVNECGDAVDDTGYVVPEVDNLSSARTMRCNDSSYEMNKPPCLLNIGDALRIMSLDDLQHKSTFNTLICQVSCPTPTQRNVRSDADSICLMNNTHPFTSSGVLPEFCNGKVVGRFPDDFSVQNVMKSNQEYPSNSYLAKPKDNFMQQCRDYQITSLDIQGAHFSSVSCETRQDFQCGLLCTLPDTDRCRENAFNLDLTFWLIFTIYFVAFLAFSPITAMSDAVCYSMLKDEWHKYGGQRFWGSIGWLCVAIATSVGVYLKDELDYDFLFYFYGVFMVVSSATAYFFDIPKDLRCGNIFKNTGKLLALPKILALLVVAFMFGMMQGSLGFVFWFLEDIGAPPQIFGPITVMNAAAGTPAMFLMGRVIKRLGPVPCICMGLVAMSVRLLGYTLLGNPWLVLLTELLHGVAYSLVVASATTYISWVSPPGLSATSQGLFGAVLESLGRGVGVILAGWLMGAVGARITYAIFASAGLTVCVAYALLHCCVFKDFLPSKNCNQQTAENGGIPDMKSESVATALTNVDKPLCDVVTVNMDELHPHSAQAGQFFETCDPLLTNTEDNTNIQSGSS